MIHNAWAEKYSNDVLELAYSMTFSQASNPAHLFDKAWHEANVERRRRIHEELIRRGVHT